MQHSCVNIALSQYSCNILVPKPVSHRTNALQADSAINLHDLTLGYARHPAVHHLSITIAAGTLMAVVGPNGAGKSTLIKALAGGIQPMGGRIEGLERQRVAGLPQQPDIDRSFPINVRDMVMQGLWHEVRALGRYTAAHREACHMALAEVGLLGFEKRGIDSLSGGQWQRVLFARLILQNAPVMLLDEPFSAVDQRTTEDLVGLLHRWHACGKTVVAVLHDLALVRAHFPQTLLLAREPIAWGATGDVLTPANWQRALLMHEPFDKEAPLCDRSPSQPMAGAMA